MLLKDKNCLAQFLISLEAKLEKVLIAMCSISRLYSTCQCGFVAIFKQFYIQKTYRGQGVASNLVKDTSDYCREYYMDSIWVGAS